MGGYLYADAKSDASLPAATDYVAAGEAPAPGPQGVFPALIRRWADTLAGGDLGGHMELYAGRLSRFNGLINPSIGAVRSRKQQQVAAMRGARDIRLLNLRVVQPSGASIASATFTVTWSDDGERRSGRFRLTFRRSGADWFITSEEQLG